MKRLNRIIFLNCINHFLTFLPSAIATPFPHCRPCPQAHKGVHIPGRKALWSLRNQLGTSNIIFNVIIHEFLKEKTYGDGMGGSERKEVGFIAVVSINGCVSDRMMSWIKMETHGFFKHCTQVSMIPDTAPILIPHPCVRVCAHTHTYWNRKFCMRSWSHESCHRYTSICCWSGRGRSHDCRHYHEKLWYYSCSHVSPGKSLQKQILVSL